jgi:formylglycine-generating enzyme required for sulfatase activity
MRRAGTTSPFATGAAVTPDQANFQTPFKDDGENREGEYREQTIKVGSFPPNAFDLHDMHGNAWEWVQDNWHEDYAGAPSDGAVRPGGDKTQRAKRGGGWYSLVVDLRSARRRHRVSGGKRAVSSSRDLPRLRELQRSARDFGSGAPGRTRTSTTLRPPDFESGASTDSATGARERSI